MTNHVRIADRNVWITLPDGQTIRLYRDGSMELLNAPDVDVYDDRRISMGGSIRLHDWLSAAIRRAAVGYAETHQLKPIPAYGDHMSIEEFKESCDDGTFTEDDGGGYYATENEISGIEVLQSLIRVGIIDKAWTHVVWFNK
jgi:hypothetical protein